MILSSLKLQNFKKYRDFEIGFDEGLTGIIGRNGSGKSTLFEAVLFVLYGESRGAKENLKNARAGEKEAVSVELEFEIDGRSYKVARELRGKALTARAKLYDSEDALLSDGAREVTTAVAKLVGMSKEAFLHTVFASQKELTALSGLKNEERKKIIRKLLGLEKIDKIEEEIRKTLTDINRDVKSYAEILLSEEALKSIHEAKEAKQKEAETLKISVAGIVASMKAKQSEIDVAQKELTTLQSQKEAYTKLQNDQNMIAQNLTNASSSLQNLTTKLKELSAKQSQYEAEKHLIEAFTQLENSLKTHQAAKEKQLSFEGLQKEQMALRSQYKSIEHEIKSLEKKLAKLDKIKAHYKDRKKTLEVAQNSLKEIESHEKKLRDEISRYHGQIDDVRIKVEGIRKLGRESGCPTCTRPLLDEYDKVIGTLEETMKRLQDEEIAKREKHLKELTNKKEKEQIIQKAIEKEIHDLAAELKVLESDAKQHERKQKEFEGITARGMANKEALAKLGEIVYDKAAHEKAIADHSALVSKQKELIGLQSLIAQIPATQKEIESLEVRIKTLESEKEAKAKEIAAQTYDAKLHESKTTGYALLLKVKDDINVVLRAEERKEEAVRGEIKAIEKELETDARQRKQLQSKLDDKNDYEKLKLFMGEFKNKINAKVAPRISELASSMYASITRGKYESVEVDEAFDFYIYDEGVRYPIERFSGGEIDLANLVLRIAISKTLSELNGSGGVGFLAFDEVFGSQDEERRMEIMEAFHTIKEQYRQIFLISHEREIKEMFERVVEL